MEKKVSVIIPFYNGVTWLCEAVQSVLDQTYKNVEIIVINDGSPEDITPFLNKYKEKVIYYKQENQGPAVARNYGMQIATGTYIAFLDSDDLWLPTKLEKQIPFMENNGFKWSHTGFYFWWPQNNRLEIVNNKNDYDDISLQMKISFRMATPSVVIHHDVIKEHPEINFPPELRKAQDTAYFKKLAKYYKVALIQEPLVKVRMRGENTNTLVLLRFEKKNELYIETKKQPEKFSFTEKFIYTIYHIYHKIFGKKRNKLKEFVAKCFWAIPFSIERIYLKHLIRQTTKSEKYILRWDKKS